MSKIITAFQRNGVAFPERYDEISRNLGIEGAQRKIAAKALAGGQSVSYRGARFDGIKGGDESKRMAKAELLLRSAAHAEAYARQTGVRHDGDIPMASQGLTHILQTFYKIGYAELEAASGSILPIRNLAAPAEEEIVWYERDVRGLMRVGNTYSINAIPMSAGPVVAVNRIRVLPALCGYEQNFMDGRREAAGVRNGKPDFQIEDGKIESCKRAIEEAKDSVWLYGESTVGGVDGVHSSPYVGYVSSSPGLWSTLSTADLVEELTKLFNWIPNATQGRLGDKRRVTLMLPPEQYDRAVQAAVGVTDSRSPWNLVRDSLGLSDDQLQKRFTLQASNSQISAGGGQGLARDKALLKYEAGDVWDPAFIVTQPVEIPVAPVNTGMGLKTIFHTRFGGIMIQDAARLWAYEGL